MSLKFSILNTLIVRYIVTGGEDDLVTVWSLQDHKITARGEGHKSWVTMVTFDPYNSKGIASNGR